MATDVSAVHSLTGLATVTYATVPVRAVDVTGLPPLVSVPEPSPSWPAAQVIVGEATEVSRLSEVEPIVSLSSEWVSARRCNVEFEELARLPADFDGEGSPSYSHGTIAAARALVRELSGTYSQEYTDPFQLPAVMPGPNGSVDLRWRVARFNLLVNVPPPSERAATAYGMDPTAGEDISLRLENEESREHLLRWVHDRWVQSR